MNIDPNAYLSTPPALIEAAQDCRYYEEIWEQLNKRHTSEKGEFLAKFKDSGAWRSKYKSWDQCCYEYLEYSKRHVDRLIAKSQTNAGHGCPKETPAAVLATVNDLPNPLAELEAQFADAIEPKTNRSPQTLPVPAPQPVPERTRATPTESGKPIYAMAAWRELEEYIGKAINRTDSVNHLLPNPAQHKSLMADLHSAFTKAECWHEMARK